MTAFPIRNKVALVTGANAGLGYQLSVSLAKRGAHVIMACRSAERADRARSALLAAVPGADTTVIPLDVTDLASIRMLGQRVAERVGHLDLLIHNAGIYGVPYGRTPAGHELHFATNYLGAFALTGVLLPLLRDVRGARIISVGSLAHRLGRLRPHEPDMQPARYSPWAAYGASKVALLAFTLELDRRLQGLGSQIIALAAHPGFALTDGAVKLSLASAGNGLGRWLARLARLFIPDASQAAVPIVHAAYAEDVCGGEYYGPGGWFEIAGAPRKARISAQASNAELATQLWSRSEALTGVRYLS